MMEPLLEAENLEKKFAQNPGLVNQLLGETDYIHAVDGVSLELHENEVQGVIGESGCGKSTLIMTLMKIHQPSDGVIRYKGKDITDAGREEMKEYRRNVQMIFQNPFESLDPKMRVRDILREPLEIHGLDESGAQIKEALENVEMNPPEKYLAQRPDQLSGGERQRVSIARALISDPEIILADEPLSMLDVSTQASILNLMERLTDDLDLSMIYISHDLSTLSYICDKINVMYLGRIVEKTTTEKILNDPKHPYSRALISAIPIPDPESNRERTELEGSTPDPVNIGSGCRFRDRCPDRMDICEKTPKLVEVEDDHRVSCHLHYDHEELATSANGVKGEDDGQKRSEAAKEGGTY